MTFSKWLNYDIIIWLRQCTGKDLTFSRGSDIIKNRNCTLRKIKREGGDKMSKSKKIGGVALIISMCALTGLLYWMFENVGFLSILSGIAMCLLYASIREALSFLLQEESEKKNTIITMIND